MEQLSSDIDQERLINTVNELTIRLVQMEELIKEISSRVQIIDVTLESVSSDHKELANKVAPTQSNSSQEGESFSSGQGTFHQTYLRDMMTSLSIPGLKFIGEKGQPWSHSCLWIFIHIVALLLSYVLIKEEYDKWKTSPVVKTISNNLTYVNEIPFPAVTVCLPSYIKNVYDYLESTKKCISCNTTNGYDCVFNETCSFEEKASLAIASQICSGKEFDALLASLSFDQNKIQSIGGEEFSLYSKKILPQCDVHMTERRSTGDFIFDIGVSRLNVCNGKGYFKFVSNLNMCFTVNGLLEKDIFKENTIISREEKTLIDEEYTKESLYKGKDFTLKNMFFINGDIGTTPAYMSVNNIIQLVFHGRGDEDSANICAESGRGAMDALFFIHNPVDVPFINNRRFYLRFGEGKVFRVISEMLVTEKGLESYKPLERGCYYSHERELAMFKHYSENNCRTECAANCSLQHCGCVPHYLPRHNSSVRVCLGECDQPIECEREACSCLPDCYSLSYDLEIVEVIHVDGAGNKWQGSKMELSYKTSAFYATVRVSLTNLAQFMAYCLGIVGVFNGFSIMIIFEIFYFVTFRLWISLKSYLK